MDTLHRFRYRCAIGFDIRKDIMTIFDEMKRIFLLEPSCAGMITAKKLSVRWGRALYH